MTLEENNKILSEYFVRIQPDIKPLFAVDLWQHKSFEFEHVFAWVRKKNIIKDKKREFIGFQIMLVNCDMFDLKEAIKYAISFKYNTEAELRQLITSILL